MQLSGDLQGYGTAEAAVKVVKMMFKKAPYLAILEHRCTPDATGYTSSQKLNSRRIRSTMPVKPESLSPNPVQIEKFSERAHRIKADRRAKALPQLEVGNHVRAKLHPKSVKEWQPAQVTATQGNSYNVMSGSREYRRNRIHIRPSTVPSPTSKNKPVEIAISQKSKKKAPDPPETCEAVIETESV